MPRAVDVLAEQTRVDTKTGTTTNRALNEGEPESRPHALLDLMIVDSPPTGTRVTYEPGHRDHYGEIFAGLINLSTSVGVGVPKGIRDKVALRFTGIAP